MTFLYWLHFILTAVFALPVFLFADPMAAAAFAAGSLLAAFNYWTLAFAWSRILGKKSVALAVGVIVIKYATFGILLFWLTQQHQLSVVWFMIGFTVALVTAFGVAIRESRRSEEEAES